MSENKVIIRFLCVIFNVCMRFVLVTGQVHFLSNTENKSIFTINSLNGIVQFLNCAHKG